MSIYRHCRGAILSAPDERAIRMALLECLSQAKHEILLLSPEITEILADALMPLNCAAIVLLQADMTFRGGEREAAALRDIASLYSAASVRLTQLHVDRQAEAWLRDSR